MSNSDIEDVDWEDETGIRDTDIRTENNACIGEQDPISLNPIEKGDEIKFDGQCYSRKNLLKWLTSGQGKGTLPHNRRVLAVGEFTGRDIRGGLNKRKKKTTRKRRKSRKSRKGRKGIKSRK